MKPRDPDTPRAEDALPLLVGMLGDDLGQRVYLALIRRFLGQRVNFPHRIETDLLARVVYERRCKGESALAIACAMDIPRWKVDRLYSRELKRRRVSTAA